MLFESGHSQSTGIKFSKRREKGVHENEIQAMKGCCNSEVILVHIPCVNHAQRICLVGIL